MVKRIVEDATRTPHVEHIVLSLCVGVAEGEAWDSVEEVVIVTLGVRDGDPLAHHRLAVVDVDQIDLVRAEKLVSPSSHRHRERSRVCLEGALLGDAVVEGLAPDGCAVTCVFGRHLVLARAVYQLLAPE